MSDDSRPREDLLDELRRARDAASNGARAARALDALAVPITVTDLDGRYVIFNSAALAVLRRGSDDVLGKTAHDFLSGAQAERATAMEAQVRKTGQPVQVGYHVDFGEGPRTFEMIKSPLRNPSGEIEGVVSISHDVTELREAEKTLDRNVREHQSIIEDLPAGVVQVRLDGTVAFANKEGARLLGLSADALEQLDVRHWDGEVVYADGSPCPVDQFPVSQCLATGDPQYGRMLGVRLPDGRTSWAIFSARPIYEDGELSGALVVFPDATQRREAEAKRDALLQELNHRVKNTLASLLGLMGETARGHAEMDDFRETLTARVHAMARLHDGLAEVDWGPVSIEDVVGRTVAAHVADGRVQVTGARCDIVPDVALPLGQALFEFVTNAIKHGALAVEQGRIHIEWLVDDAGALRLIWEESGGPLVGPVNTSGVGLSIIRGLIEHEIGGEVDLSFPSTGARHEIRIPKGAFS